LGPIPVGVPAVYAMNNVGRRRWAWWLSVLAACALLAYLYNPPWLAGVTSGFGGWERDGAGVRFRWMGGRASFFIPAGAESVDIPFQPPVPPPSSEPFLIDVQVDGKRALQVALREGGWVTATLPIRSGATRRHFRRIDLFADRTWSERSLSVRVGEVTVRVPGHD
jgi:hypothetical protein